MPKKEYNSFYKWIAADDYLTHPEEYLWWKNVDWARTWYGITLWPKVNSHMLVDCPISDIASINASNESQQFISWNNGVDTGYVYAMDSADNTPVRTFTSAETSYFYIQKVIEFNGDYFILGKNWPTAAWWALHLSKTDIEDSWSYPVTYNVTTGNNSFIPPHVFFWGSLYIGSRGSVKKVTISWSSYTYTPFQFTWMDDITKITVHNSVMYIYDRNWQVRYWKWQESVSEWENSYPYQIRKGLSQWSYDLATTAEWDLIAVGWDTATPLSSKRQSKFWETFGTYFDIKNFWITDRTTDGETMVAARFSNYIIADGKYIYKFAPIIPGMSPSFHNIVSKTNDGTDIDRIYTMAYRASEQKLFFSYKAWTTYWIDYIDLSSNESCDYWVFYTPVHRWVPNEVNQVVSHILTVSQTNGTKYVKVSLRVNGWSWVQIRNINEATEVITKEKSESIKKKFVDCQFKIEFGNTGEDTFPPILHSFMQNYKIVDK